MARSGLILLAVCLALGTAACGGGGGGAAPTTQTTSTQSTQGQGSTGQAILKQAGLTACTQNQASGAGFVGSGLVQSVTSVVAPSCATKPAVPTTLTALTYNTQDAASQSAAAAKKAHPKAEVITPTIAPYTTTVLVISGPKASEYAASIEQALPKG